MDYDTLNIEISRINLFKPNQEQLRKIQHNARAIPVQSSNQLSYRVKWLYFNIMPRNSSAELEPTELHSPFF
jgi:hypothetical protein